MIAVLGCGAAACGEPAAVPDASLDATVIDATAAIRGVTNPQLVFAGTETTLVPFYDVYDQDPAGEVSFVDDPVHGPVLRMRKSKASDWQHVMVRLGDKRTGYQDAARLPEYERAYHYQQKFKVTADPQFSTVNFNLLEDFHCEPCEANNLQLVINYNNDDSLCLWVAYSTDANFDPRGTARGSSFDPWPTINANRTQIAIGEDGRASVPANLPSTGALFLCRDDLHLSDISDRWVDFEMIVRSSSHDSGVIKMWIDGKPYFFDGPNSYRWNQLDASSAATNNFQLGLYGEGVTPQTGTPSTWELQATPPRVEIGDDVRYEP